MKESILHPVYGLIVYEESFWTGKKNLLINGIYARPFSKKEFLFEERKVIIEGNLFMGVTLRNGD